MQLIIRTILTWAAVATLLSLAGSSGFGEERSQADRVGDFITSILDGKIATTKEEIFAKFSTLANEDPALTVRALFDITQSSGPNDPLHLNKGIWAYQLAGHGPITGDIFWKALADKLEAPETRKSAIDFLDLVGKGFPIYVADESLPYGYWAAAFAYAPLATVSGLRQADVEQNAARYGTDESYRQAMVDKLDAATLLVQLYVDLSGRATSSRASQDVCSDIHAATMTQMQFLTSHEKWWVRMYAIDAMRRCKELRPTDDELRRLVESEKDPRVLMAFRELNQP
ncbi:MAG: hypothetical protein U0795_08725 [Pirellulales bacterium]